MLKVLLVEDNHVFREAFKQNLCESFPSILIEEAGDSDEALQKINGSSPQLIFMDMRLPGMNGLQLTQKIKRQFPDIKIVILTGYDLPEYRQAALKCGAEQFFVKDSLNWEDVKSLIQSVSGNLEKAL